MQELLHRLHLRRTLSTGVQLQLVRVSMMSHLTQSMVHVAIGRIARSELEKLVSPVVVEDDNLLLGASSAAPGRHRALRARTWGGEPSVELNQELARPDGPPLCMALPPTIGGLLSFCRVCAAAAERKRLLFVIDLRPGFTGTFPQGADPAEEIYFDVAEALRGNPPMKECSELEVALAATLWKLWCRRSPVALARFCASGSALHPQLANLGRYLAGRFPRQAGDTLSLARFDELLLRQLSREWITSTRVFTNAVRENLGLHAWLAHMGDLYVPKRLLEWARHDQGRIVECEERPERPSEMSRWAFRWRPGGEAILEALPRLEDAPPVSVGGAVAYDAAHPWVCRLDAAGTPYLSRLGATPASDRPA
ncbi:hypothetical protein BE17_18070 [Sorangium cellulosum]|uniref:Uncharacterized protein n=1 Tax=Sorangium cellulosum TaxID=56 RepID=A0A150RHT2_SORCE|nr:hypothetical protein BE17_18070 [Sorangium cellulosum]